MAEELPEINRITSAGSTPDLRAVKRVSGNSANDIDIFVTRLSAEIPVFHKQHALAMDALGRVAMISDVDLDANPKNFESMLKSLKECRGANLECSNNMSELRGALSDLPRMTTAFARARRRAVAVMDDLLVQMGVAANQTQDIEELLERMIDPPDSGSQ
ncbi:MAG: hypothetical protein IID42_11350 [Planctomycetes bacterium]|nr:hypothetical protein [Planctomycetota bacterium]